MSASKASRSGLTPTEEVVMDHLVAAYNGFAALPHRPDLRDDRDDFRRSIHEAQRIMCQRVVARTFPDYWNAKE